MTPEQQVKYLADPDKCPFCGAGDVEAQPGFEWDDMQMWQIVFCVDDDCSRQWRDIYTLTGVEDADVERLQVGVKASKENPRVAVKQS